MAWIGVALWLAAGYAAGAILKEKNIMLFLEYQGVYEKNFDHKFAVELWATMCFGAVSLVIAIIVAAREKNFGWYWWNPFAWVSLLFD